MTYNPQFLHLLSIIRQGIDRNAKMSDDEMVAKYATPTFEDLGFDSLDRIDLMFIVEDAFHVQISDKDAKSFSTATELFEYLTTRNAIAETPKPQMSLTAAYKEAWESSVAELVAKENGFLDQPINTQVETVAKMVTTRALAYGAPVYKSDLQSA